MPFPHPGHVNINEKKGKEIQSSPRSLRATLSALRSLFCGRGAFSPSAGEEDVMMTNHEHQPAIGEKCSGRATFVSVASGFAIRVCPGRRTQTKCHSMAEALRPGNFLPRPEFVGSTLE